MGGLASLKTVLQCVAFLYRYTALENWRTPVPFNAISLPVVRIIGFSKVSVWPCQSTLTDYLTTLLFQLRPLALRRSRSLSPQRVRHAIQLYIAPRPLGMIELRRKFRAVRSHFDSIFLIKWCLLALGSHPTTLISHSDSHHLMEEEVARVPDTSRIRPGRRSLLAALPSFLDLTDDHRPALGRPLSPAITRTLTVA